MMLDEVGKLETLKAFSCVQKFAMKKEWLKLGVIERMMMLVLPSLVDDYGCMEYSPKIIRARIFLEARISRSRIGLGVRKLKKFGLINLHKTNCKMTVLYAKFIVGILPEITESKPDLPLPPQVDWYNRDEGGFTIVHSE